MNKLIESLKRGEEEMKGNQKSPAKKRVLNVLVKQKLFGELGRYSQGKERSRCGQALIQGPQIHILSCIRKRGLKSIIFVHK